MAQLKQRKVFGDLSGSLAVRGEYGYIPFLLDASFPSSLITGKADFSFTLMNIPLRVSATQSDKQTINGYGNRFTLSFDANAYQARKLQDLQVHQRKLSLHLDSLNNSKSALQKELNYIRFVKFKEGIPDPTRFSDNIPLIKDTLSLPTDSIQFSNDSLHLSSDTLLSGNDSLPISKIPVSPIDSMDTKSLVQKYDSLNSKIRELEGSISAVKQQMGVISNMKSGFDSLGVFGGTSGFWSGVKKMEIGLCTPTYSEWLVNTQMKGVCMDVERTDVFTSFSYGTVIDINYFNFNLNNDKSQMLESDITGIFNYNNSDNGRKVISGLLGYGTRDKNYISIGYLRGIGKGNYLSSSLTEPSANGSIDKNYVAEISGQFKVRSSKFKLTYAKSALVSDNETTKPVEALSIKNDSRVWACLHTTDIPAFKLSVSTELQYIEPLFRSFGIAYRRSDRIIGKVRMKRDFGKLKTSVNYRYEEDNIKNYFSYKNQSNAIGVSASYSINRHIRLKGSFSPVEIRSRNEGVLTIFRNYNYLAGCNLRYKISKTRINTDGFYSMNYSFDTTSVFSFQTVGVNSSFVVKSTMFYLNLNYFNQESDIVNQNYGIAEAGSHFVVMKNLEMTTGIKTMVGQNSAPGYNAEVSWMPFSFLNFNIGMERLLTGEFNNEMLIAGTGSRYYAELIYLINKKQ